MTMPTLPEALGWILAGAALGAVYLYLVGRTVAALASPAARKAAVGYLVLRFALAVAAFWLAAQSGAAPLLMMFAGFLLARTALLRRATRG
jgi:F1F0 ATPase subunit 2